MKTYLQYQSEAFKKIAEAMNMKRMMVEYSGECWLCWQDLNEYDTTGAGKTHILGREFNPMTNAEQWADCLMWYRDELTKTEMDETDCFSIFFKATESREALLISILEMIDETL